MYHIFIITEKERGFPEASTWQWVAHGWTLLSWPEAFGTGYHATTCDWCHRCVSWALSTKYQRHAARQFVGLAQVADLHRFVFQALLGFKSVGERERAWRYLLDTCGSLACIDKTSKILQTKLELRDAFGVVAAPMEVFCERFWPITIWNCWTIN